MQQFCQNHQQWCQVRQAGGWFPGGLALLELVSSSGKDRETGGQPSRPHACAPVADVALGITGLSVGTPFLLRAQHGPSVGVADPVCGVQACPFSTPSF